MVSKIDTVSGVASDHHHLNNRKFIHNSPTNRQLIINKITVCGAKKMIKQNSAVSQRSIDLEIVQPVDEMTSSVEAIDDDAELSQKLQLQLDVKEKGLMMEKGSVDEEEKEMDKGRGCISSPKTPLSPISIAHSVRPGIGTINVRSISHQTSLTSQVDVVDDRKALRDALYQGIFHRHRRTIFAVGSFLRMLRSRNSQYNTIRSSSEGEDDTR